MKSRRLFRIWVAVGLLSPAAWAGSPRAPAWPGPPAQSYIVYSNSISRPADVGAKPAALRRFSSWVTGATQDAGEFEKPFGLALDSSGNLLITDTGTRSVSVLELARKRWLHWDAIGEIHFECPVAIARLGPMLFVADSALGKIIAFDEKGKLQFELTRELERPTGLAAGPDRLFVADSQRHQVVIFSGRGELISKFGSRGSGPGEFNFPTHVAVDSAARIYVTDSMNSRVQVFDPQGKFLRTIGGPGDKPGQFSRPKGVALDPAGHIYVVDALFDNVQIFDDQSRLLLNWGESGSDAGQFWLPNAIAISPNNEIYVADSFNRRIQVFRYTGKP